MTLYELFILARPSLGRVALSDVLRKTGNAVFAKGGVITDIKSFGERPLAYEIRKPTGVYSEAAMVEISFKVTPAALPEVEHLLRVDERVLRWMLGKRRATPKLPNTFRVNNYAQSVVPELPNPYEALKPALPGGGAQRPARP